MIKKRVFLLVKFLTKFSRFLRCFQVLKGKRILKGFDSPSWIKRQSNSKQLKIKY